MINLGQFTGYLFSRPSYGHYYIGDYYASSYNNAGYYPWFSFATSGNGYDPFYASQRWANRQNVNWESQLQSDFQRLQENEDARPPRTFAAQSANLANNADETQNNTRLTLSLNDLVENQANQDNQIQFKAMDKEERQQLGKRGQEMQKFLAERQRVEAELLEPTSGKESNTNVDPKMVKVQKSPIAASSDGNANNGVDAPKAQEVPDVDPNVEPKPRNARKSRENPVTSPTDPNAPGEKNKPAVDARKGRSKVAPVDAPDNGKKGTPKSDRPKANPKPDRPKSDPDAKPGTKPDRPKVDPKPDAPKAAPKPDRPKVDPKPDRPKVDPKPDVPKANVPKANVPKPDVPKPDIPKVNP